MNVYYLLPERKRAILEYLASPEREIDPLLSEFVDKINAYPDFATTQCCQGHPEREVGALGYVSIMVTEHLAKQFEEEVIPALVVEGYWVEKDFELIEPYLDKPTVRFVIWFVPERRDQFCTRFLELIDQLSTARAEAVVVRGGNRDV